MTSYQECVDGQLFGVDEALIQCSGWDKVIVPFDWHMFCTSKYWEYESAYWQRYPNGFPGKRGSRLCY